LSVNSSNPGEKAPIKLPVIIVAVVLLIVFLAWYGHRALSPTGNVTNDLTKGHDAWMAKVSKEAGPSGDVSKINPTDRAAFLKRVSGSPEKPETILQHAYQKFNGN